MLSGLRVVVVLTPTWEARPEPLRSLTFSGISDCTRRYDYYQLQLAKEKSNTQLHHGL